MAATFFWTRVYSASELRDIAWFGMDGWLELTPIATTYGPNRFSRNVEEWIIRDFFQDRHNGVFLDVGANHYRDESNTYHLETQLGWSGVAADALEEFAADYRAHRPRTRYFARFVSDVTDSSSCRYRLMSFRAASSSSRDFLMALFPVRDQLAAN